MMRAPATDPLGGGLRSLLVGGTLGTAALLALARLFGFASTLVLAALMGASGYGAYAWAIAWMAVLAVPSTLGRDRLLIRELAARAARSEWGPLRGVLTDSLRAVAVCAVAVAVAGCGVALAVAARVDSPLVTALAVGFVLLPLVALGAAVQGALQGLHRVVASQVPDAVLRPLAFLALVGGVAAATGGDLSAPGALLLQGLATAAALGATAWLLARQLPPEARTAPPEYARPEWRSAGLTMAAGATLAVVHARVDLLLVGALLGAGDAGAYGVAAAAASIAALPYMAIARPLSPVVARLHALGDAARLALAVRGATRATFAVTLVAAVALALGGGLGLGLLGHDFERAAGALALLCAAAVVNTAFAANGIVLVMTGYERDLMRATAIGVAAAVVLCTGLTALWGLPGAALGTLLSVLVRNAVTSWYAWARLGVDTTILARRL